MKTITLYHTTDLHGQILPKNSSRIGMGKISSFIEGLRIENPNLLLFNSGDFVSGDPICDLTNGISFIDIMNLCGYTASSIGNHDFDFGKENLNNYIEKSNFEFICANLFENENLITKKKYLIYEVEAIKILVIGVISRQAFNTIKERKRKGIKFIDPWKAITDIENQLFKESIAYDIVLVLNHGNTPDDLSLLCEEKQGVRVDIVLSGHDHYVSYCNYDNKRKNIKHAVHSGSNTEIIQKIDLIIDDNTKKITSINTKNFDIQFMNNSLIKDHPKVIEIEKQIRDNHPELIEDVVFCESIISKEKIRTLVERALSWQTGYDISYLTNGGIRNIFPKGNAKYEDILTICPFDDIICKVNIKGNELSAEAIERLKSEHNITICNDDTIYKIATNDYAIENNILFKTEQIGKFILSENRVEFLDNIQVKFVFIEYLKKLKRINDNLSFMGFKTLFIA